MEYKGTKLEEVTEPQIFNPPKLMLVWDNDNESPCQLNVCAIVNREQNRVITERSAWEHCAEIPEVLVTYRELSCWLAKGNGELKRSSEYFNCNYICYPLTKRMFLLLRIGWSGNGATRNGTNRPVNTLAWRTYEQTESRGNSNSP